MGREKMTVVVNWSKGVWNAIVISYTVPGATIVCWKAPVLQYVSFRKRPKERGLGLITQGHLIPQTVSYLFLKCLLKEHIIGCVQESVYSVWRKSKSDAFTASDETFTEVPNSFNQEERFLFCFLNKVLNTWSSFWSQ